MTARSNHRTNTLAGLTPIRPRRAFEHVLLQLKAAVVEGRLGVGDRLPDERELAKRFGVSRQSVREGLRMLEGLGVLSARRGTGPDSGWTVSADGSGGLGAMLDLYASLQRIPLTDLLAVRESLERLSGAGAAARATPQQKNDLAAAAVALAELTAPDHFLAADAEFHVMIARASGNTLLPVLMQAIRESMARAMLLAFSNLQNWETERELLCREHTAIADTIRAGDAEAAAKALGAHIRGFYGRVLTPLDLPEAVSRTGSR